jgi:NADPH2:quinone reductase
MSKAIVLQSPGGPENLKWQEVSVGEPKAGEVLIRQKAIGLNYIDIYHRTGFYKLPSYPAILGMEGAGVVEKLGPDCTHLQVGDRVAYGVGPIGGYAQLRIIPEIKLVKLPDAIKDEIAAASMLKGLTAHFLLRRTFIVNNYHTILVHAAAGGVGLLLCQWAKSLGARVIGTVGSPEKAALAHANGCDFPILYKSENILERVRQITEGRMVHAVYDAIGKDTYKTSLDCLMRFGIFISYGQASGPLPPIDSQDLASRGSLFFTRPSLMHYKEDPHEYALSSAELFEMIRLGHLKVNVGQSYYLSDAASAHRDLETGKTSGTTILLPG